MQTATFEALLTPAGAALLAEATAAYGREDEFALGTRLRRSHPGELVAAALTQARLRARAADKFEPADAARMFFTVDGYEQATRVAVARHRASRLAAASGAGAAVADLCCGIGGDLVELARAGLAVTGVEADPLTAAMAAANVAALELTDAARVECGDATAVDRTAFAAVVCDPARRGSRGRVFDPGAYRPPWPFVLELLAATACVKVAPGIPHDLLPGGVEAEWVSERGEVKEAALWSGGLAPGGVQRRATLLPSGATLTDRDDPGPVVRPLGGFLYEPDGAVIRAGLVTAAAALVGGGLVDPSIAYVTADDAVATPFARGYRVVDTLPYDVKTLRRYVREQGIGILTVKKRGVGVEPEKLRAAVRPQGDAVATFVVTRVAGKATVIVAEPLPQGV
ncbi:SAM-dependent methyltransferase [Jiangella ureilytica]|uniref:SAM-dependent methyltransferase n=1 Tax=Jiangella ureilytica TaxID=2530374 RepID=A0A4R4RI86_9ACTN|nr:SAM-dependent methyltransferase [Jiangella ureilytica]TDC49167.1 SAM-dependent methyltransferase [Jiangella ureilytica]